MENQYNYIEEKYIKFIILLLIFLYFKKFFIEFERQIKNVAQYSIY